MSALHLNIDSYTLFWYYILGLVLLIGLAHITTYFFNVRAARLNLKTQRAFLLRTQRHLSTFWWVLIAAILVMVFGVTGALVVCAIVSFMGLREFVTLTPVKSGDYRALFFSFFVFLPLQYVLIGLQEFGFFTVLIPVYAFLLLPILTIVHADTDRFLSRSASMQWGLMIAVYCLSHTVAILQTQAVIDFSTAGKALMLLFFLILVRFSMLWQHLADYAFRSRTTRIAAKIHSRMTWQGFVVSALMNALIAAAFFKLTPFTFWQAAIAGALIASSAVFGRLVMRGITYSLGVKDWGELTGGQQGVMDRLDAFLYAAPIFFHYAQFVTEHGGF